MTDSGGSVTRPLLLPRAQLWPMRVAYADPPYPGYAHYYADDPQAAEVDHGELIERLNMFDAWALHTGSNALREILPLCPPDVRVMAWVKPFASFKPERAVQYAWEPVILRGGRRRRGHDRRGASLRDWLAEKITMQRGLIGAKPEAVAVWVFECLGMRPEDQLEDLYPGSGAIGRAWDGWRERRSDVA
jgi:hypothetical protein